VKTMIGVIASIGVAVCLTGCQPSADVSYTPPFGLITFSINTAGQVSVHTESPKLVTAFGTFSVEGSVGVGETDKEKQWTSGLNLVIRQTIGGHPQDTGYHIDSDHKKRVLLNGQFVEDIEPNTVTIAVVPGVDSIVNVLDLTAATPPPLPSAPPVVHGPWRVSDRGVTVEIDGVARSDNHLTIIARVTTEHDLDWPGGLGVRVLDNDGNLLPRDGGSWEGSPHAQITQRSLLTVKFATETPPTGLTLDFDVNIPGQGSKRMILRIPSA
jgi:hypothetical protein